ncbi:PilX N-terminal domain-containing pilus assembly protein [Halomonas sp. CS7]|uniref:PilX N-terminal domain-containing pilus assembly protein n=1 Tax=Halomonas pelophila TaxID=3151122 RepID=A0ABV1NAE7_9GAMM
MHKTQAGAALIVSLVLLTVALLLGVSSMQASRLQEAMAGNQRALETAQMASESGTSKFYSWLRGQTSWPSDLSSVPWNNGDVGTVGDYAMYQAEAICWGPESDDTICGSLSAEHVKVTMQGYPRNRPEISATIVSRYKKLPTPPYSAAYTCFDIYCSDTVSGNAELTGEDYHVPEVFDCQGNACIASPDSDGKLEYDAYYPDVHSDDHPSSDECLSYESGTASDGTAYTVCDNQYYGSNELYGGQAQWYDFLDFVSSSGYDVELHDGDSLDFNVGGRGDYDSTMSDSQLEDSGFWGTVTPRFIEVIDGAEVTVSASTNTLGVIVVRDGAVLDYHGTSTHEGVIIIEPGGTLKFSSGNPQVYGGIVALQSVNSEGEIVTGSLELSGNMGVHYSSAAWKLLYQGGKGVRLVAWYEDVSQ